MSGLMWIQTIWHSDGIFLKEFLRNLILKNQQTTKKHENFSKVLNTALFMDQCRGIGCRLRTKAQDNNFLIVPTV